MCEVRGSEVRQFEVTPEQLGLPREELSALRGGDAAENAELLRGVLRGEPGARRTAVVMNAGAALAAAGVSEEIVDGVRLAERAIDSGAALDRLDRFLAATQRASP